MINIIWILLGQVNIIILEYSLECLILNNNSIFIIWILLVKVNIILNIHLSFYIDW